jgi:hypothetical protein
VPIPNAPRPPLRTLPAQALLWLAYALIFLQADVAAGLRCLEELRATPEAHEMCARPVCNVIALKACLLTRQGDQACGELMRLVDNEAAGLEMCLVAAVECLEVRGSPCWVRGGGLGRALLLTAVLPAGWRAMAECAAAVSCQGLPAPERCTALTILQAGVPLARVLPAVGLLQERFPQDASITLKVAKQALADPKVGGSCRAVQPCHGSSQWLLPPVAGSCWAVEATVKPLRLICS